MLTEALIATICLAAAGLPTVGFGLWLRRKGMYHREPLQTMCYSVGGILLALALVGGVISLQLVDAKNLKDGVAKHVQAAGYAVTGKTETVIDGHSWKIHVRPTEQNNCVDELYVDYEKVSDHFDYTITEGTFPESAAAQRCKKNLDG